MKKIALSFLCMILLGIQGFSQANIAAARAMPEGSTVTIRGVVTNGAELGIIRYIQDGTAGIAAYGSIVSSIDRGDSVVVTGITKNYNFLLELDPVTSIVAIAPKPLPAPIILTPGQMKEQYEAMLVKMVDVTFANAGGVFAGNTNYNVSANGETCQVRVNNNSNLVGQIIPASPVTLVGLCSQFSFVSPTLGYQLLLRDKNDVISTSSIVFTTPLAVSNITTSSLSLGWNTNIAGTTELFYGLTPALELGHLSTAGTGTAHAINITGLNPADLIYVQAFSVAAPDSGFSGLKTFITQSTSTGNIKTYFTRPVDTSAANGPYAIQIYRAVDDTCIAYINRAKYTIDVAIYNFNVEGLSSIAGALNAAYARGVTVRIVTDGSTNNSAIENALVKVLRDSCTIARPFTTGIMHNKFMVIDGQSTNQNDPIVWTGSCNWTDQNVNTDANNILFIQDASLAKVYTLEFNEMFGSTTKNPDKVKARFGPAKSDNTPHELIIGGNRVEVYFSPSDGVNQQIVNHINTANSDLEVGTMLITRTLISNAIIARKNAGVTSKVIISSLNTSDATVIADLGAALGNYFRVYNEQGLLHSKAMIIDQSNSGSDPFVWTGSHNWSDAANVSNDENSIVIHDAGISNLFYQEFKKRFDLAKPYNDHTVLDLGSDTTVFARDTVTLDAGLFDTYHWSNGALTRYAKFDSSGTGIGVKKVYCRVTNQYGIQSDTILVTFRYGIGIGEPNKLISLLNVYPNPGNGNVTIGFTAKGISTVAFELLAFDGRLVWQSKTTTQPGINSVRVPDVHLAAGIYLVRLRTADGDLSRKLIVK